MKTCYFVYTWEDDKINIHCFLELLKEYIESYSEGDIEVIFDKKSFKAGDDVDRKEELIYTSDCIVIFFSPSYKARVERRLLENGVYREYKKILEVKEKGIASIIPVIIEGDATALTDEFNHKIAEQIYLCDILTKSSRQIKKRYLNKIDNLVRKIIKETDLAYKKRDYVFDSEDDKMEKLFGQSEANRILPHKCMYETDAYRSVMSQNRRYIIGRKGTGKTTFFELLEKYNVDVFESKFKALRPIKADEINMQYAYSIMSSFDNEDKLFSLNQRLGLFWEIYIYLCAIYIVCLEEELYKIEDERSIVFKEAGDILRKEKFMIEKLDSNKIHAALFISAIETFHNFFKEDLIDYSNIDSFGASLIANFNIDNVMEKYFGEKLYLDLKNAILKCKRKIMIALDGFNSVGEHFRELTISLMNSNYQDNKNEGQKRLNFESQFYRSMFTTFEELRVVEKGIMSKVSFCIIIPQDRIDQIKMKDRDFSKINFTNLSWDAIDLLHMLVKRLEFIYGEIDVEDAEEKFELIMKKHFKNIPTQIEIKIDGKDEKMPLFEYLLRISFWRPREIIKYFYEISLANKNSITSRIELTSDTLKSILYNKASDIIRNEFYMEYISVITNIEEIMEKFRGGNIILELDEVYDILIKQPFETSTMREFSNPEIKLRTLYELSVMGILVDRNIKMQENLKCNLCFNYNEGLQPLDILKDRRKYEKGQVRIVINPIFSKHLMLNYNTKEILEHYGWDYLNENHARKSAITRI